MKSFAKHLQEITYYKGRMPVGDEYYFNIPKLNASGGHDPKDLRDSPDRFGYRGQFSSYEDWEGLRFYTARDRGDKGIYAAVKENGKYIPVGIIHLNPGYGATKAALEPYSTMSPKFQGRGIGYLMYLYAILKKGLILVSDTSQYETAKGLWKKLAADPRVVVYTDMEGSSWHGRPDFRQVWVIGDELVVDRADEDDIYTPDSVNNDYSFVVHERKLFACAAAGAAKVKKHKPGTKRKIKIKKK